MSNKKQIEIEFRSMFDEEKFNSLKDFLDKNAEDLGEDDKDVYFYILPDKLLKVTDNVSKDTAKLTLKLNKIGQGSDFEEVEFPIHREEVEKAVRMFNCLELTDNIMHSFQSRHNYLYKGVELALKYSLEWKHHLELEIVINKETEKEDAERRIQEVADDLDIKIMSEEELERFTKEAESKNKKNTK